MQTMIRGYELILFVHIQYFNAYYSHPQPTTPRKRKKNPHIAHANYAKQSPDPARNLTFILNTLIAAAI